MSDKKPPVKKVFGRGRGKPIRSEGPWSRSKKFDETHDVRLPKKDGEEFVLSESSFPPLPGAAATGDQFEDVEEAAGTSKINGAVNNGQVEKSKVADEIPEEMRRKAVIRGKEESQRHSTDKKVGEELPVNNQHTAVDQKKVKTREESNHEVNLETSDSEESNHEDILKEKDRHSNKPSEIVYYKGEKLLLMPSGRKFKINADGTLGKRIFMLDDLRRSFLYTQEHLAKLILKRETRKQALLKKLNEETAAASIDVANSNLSPYADEFVPKQNMNPEAQDFIPCPTGSNYCDETNNNKTQSSASNININDTTAILADLEETVNFCHSKLNETPGSYDELIGVVTPHFLKYLENPDLPSEIVQTLYNYAILDTKFSYFAVKILMHLIKITCDEGNTTLRDKLLRHTQEEVQVTQNSRLTDPDVSCSNVIRPFLTFLSELYIQLEVGGRHLRLIGCSLVDTLKQLLMTAHIPIKERLKLIVDMLKLTGLSLDQDDTTLLDDLLFELSKTLEQECSNLDSPTVQFVNDIILLRSLRWGYMEPEFENNDITNTPNGNQVPYQSNHSQSNGYEPTFDSNLAYGSGVFYGPDGHPIGYEEQLFLEVESNALNQLQLGDQGEPSPTSVEGFDEAYEEFLKTVPGHSSQ